MRSVERTLDSGLILSEYGMDGAAIERELRKRDRDLSLQGWPSQTHGCILWKVVRYAGPDRPPDTVAVWQSDRGEPFPLSSGILDLVDRLDKNTRHHYADEDERNEGLKRERRKQDARDREALLDDYKTVMGPGHAGMLPRGQSLRRARDKRRNRGEKC